MPETCTFSLSSPPCSYLYELKAASAAWGAGGSGCGGIGREKEQDERGSKGEEEGQPPSAACQAIFLFWGNYIVSSKGLFASPFLSSPHLQNRVPCCILRAIEEIQLWKLKAKGRKAITSVLVIKRICIMNHMPKGPVLHVGQIFVWIFNFYIQMKHSAQSTHSKR